MSKLKTILARVEAFRDRARALETRVVSEIFYSAPVRGLKVLGNLLIVAAFLSLVAALIALLGGELLLSASCLGAAATDALLGAIFRDWARLKTVIGEPDKIDLHGLN